MALTPEDKKDVKGAMGKALANKVSKVTKDKGQDKADRSFQKAFKARGLDKK